MEAKKNFFTNLLSLYQHLDDWSFDVFALAESGNCMPVKYIGYDLLNRYGIIHKFKVQSATLETFLSRIEEGEAFLLVVELVCQNNESFVRNL